MKKYIVISALVGIGLVGGAFYYVYEPKKMSGSLELDEALQAATLEALNEVGTDSDKDELSDWEERLWKTDPENPDTDGDGTKDGEETRNKRDPTKVGPNDQIVSELLSTQAPSATSTLFTQGSFARAYAEMYATLETGGTLTAEQKDELAQHLISDITGNPILRTQKAVTIDDLTLIDNNSKEAYDRYSKGFLAAVKVTEPSEPENEAEILARAMQTNTHADFAKIGMIGKTHEALADALVKLEAPSKIALFHLELINSLYNLSLADAGMERMETDRITGVAALQRYIQGSRRLSSAMTALSLEFEKMGFSF